MTAYYTEQNKHARERAELRYNTHFSDAGFKRIVDKIAQGKAECIRRHVETKTIYKVAYNGNILNVVFNEKSKKVCTFLTDEQLPTQMINAKEASVKLCKYCKEKEGCHQKDYCENFKPSALLTKLELLDVVYTLQAKLNFIN